MNRKTIIRHLFRVLIVFLTYNCSSNSPTSSDDTDPILIDDNNDDENDDNEIKYTTVNTIEEFIASLYQNNVNIKLAQGTYKFGPEDVTSGLIPNYEMFVFRGNNTNYDFTGVTFEFDTKLWSSYGSKEVVQLRLYGNNINVKNLTIVDIGEERPTWRARNIHFDGLDNTIDGFTIHSRGSFPYGYGDIFGKGSEYVIKHFKHSTILIRGERNHLKNTIIHSRTYGHGIFVQGGIDTVIEGCELYGEVRSTDDILAEEGTDSPADNVNFLSVWGHKITPGGMFSLQEDGIRAYNTGPHYITGETVHTSGLKVINCKIDKFRSGVTIGFTNNEKLVENCEATGCENAYWVGSSGNIVNSRGDIAYGFLYNSHYDNDSNSNIELTIIDSPYEKFGNHNLMYLGGTGHNITLKTNENKRVDGIDILFSGKRGGTRYLSNNDEGLQSRSIKLINETKYPVTLSVNSTSNNIYTCGEYTDNGNLNFINEIDCN